MKNALAATITTLPEQLRRSLTWDRGKEMSAHAQFKVETGLPVFFADPHSPLAARQQREHCEYRSGPVRADSPGWCRQREVTLENTGPSFADVPFV
jgi:IS30 family transposase